MCGVGVRGNPFFFLCVSFFCRQWELRVFAKPARWCKSCPLAREYSCMSSPYYTAVAIRLNTITHTAHFFPHLTNYLPYAMLTHAALTFGFLRVWHVRENI